MSTIIAEETSAENKTKYKKSSTSMFLDKTLWLHVRRAAFDKGITATEFVETALLKELDLVQSQSSKDTDVSESEEKEQEIDD